MTKPSLALIPSGYKASKVYSILPNNGDGDFTFSRSSTATRVNKDGLIETVASNIPRLDYTDGGCPSLLLETQRTNNILNSESLSNASWTKYNAGTASTITVTDNYAISPSGEMNASRLQMSLNGGTTSGDITFIRQSLTSQTNYYFSVYLKSTNGEEQKLNWHYGSDDFLITVTNEWQRFELNRNSNATTFAGIGLMGNLVSALGIDDSVDILVYGFQVEQGSYPTSYIPTNGSTATRLRDQCVNNDLDFIIQDEGSVYWEGAIQGETPILIQLSPDTGIFSNTIYIEYASSVNQLRMRVYSGGVLQSFFSTTVQKNTIYKIALGYKENDIVGVVNGSIIGTDASALIQSGLSNVNIGELRGVTNDAYNGVTLKKALLYDKRLSNEELQELTTI